MKYLFVLIAIAFVFVSHEISQIHVIEDYESPDLYRVFYLITKYVGLYAKLVDYLGFGSEYATFRDGISFKFLNVKTIESNEFIQVTDKYINEVKIRMYFPRVRTQPLPLMIFTHGGGFIFGNITSYDLFIFKIAEKANIAAISIDYRLAPEYPYPQQVEDCWTVIDYVIYNAKELGIDPNKIIFSGDSAGGNLAIVSANRLRLRTKLKPFLQVLIYPWTQSFNINLPSSRRYKSGMLSTLTPGRIILWYLGITKFEQELEDAINNNEHILLIDNLDLRKKYESYFDTNLIPDKFKTQSYYKNYQNISQLNALNETHILKRDPKSAEIIKRIFDVEFSPSLADLKETSKTYMVVLEWDSLKDDNLIYAERLKQAGSEVTVAFYRNMFHGIAHMVGLNLGLTMPNIILENLVEFIKENI